MPRILVVEDSKTQALQVRLLLEENSYEVATAENGEEALSSISTFQPDVILTDMEMPVMDGLELVTTSLMQYPSIPIVLITARGSDTLAIEALDRGAAAYLPKSQLDEGLLETLDQVLGLVNADRSYAQLIESMDYNEFRFTIANDVELIGPLVDLLQQVVMGLGLCDNVRRMRIGMALEHALRNAIVHGNLALSRDEVEADREFEVAGEASLIDQRRAESPYCDRRVRVTAMLSRDEGKFVVEDEGVGFDVSTLPAAHDPHSLEREGGRGLVLIRSFMDEVTLNEQGNKITMVTCRPSTQ